MKEHEHICMHVLCVVRLLVRGEVRGTFLNWHVCFGSWLCPTPELASESREPMGDGRQAKRRRGLESLRRRIGNKELYLHKAGRQARRRF